MISATQPILKYIFDEKVSFIFNKSSTEFGGYAGASAVLIGYVSPDAFNILTVIFIVSLLIYPVTLSDKWFREINRYLVQKSVVNNKAGNENELIALGIFCINIIKYYTNNSRNYNRSGNHYV